MSSSTRKCGVCSQVLGNSKYRQLNPCDHFFHLVCLRQVYYHPEEFNAEKKKCPICAESSISREDIQFGLENSPIRKRVKLSDPNPRGRSPRNRDALGVLEELHEADNEEEGAVLHEAEEMENEVQDVEGDNEVLGEAMDVDVLEVGELGQDGVEDQPMDDGGINEAGAQEHHNNVDPEEVNQDDIDFVEGQRNKNSRNLNRFYLRVRIERHDIHDGIFKCHFCDKAFNKYQTRRSHEEANHFERLSCELCAAKFRRSAHLVRHMKDVHERAEFQQPNHGGRRPF